MAWLSYYKKSARTVREWCVWRPCAIKVQIHNYELTKLITANPRLRVSCCPEARPFFLVEVRLSQLSEKLPSHVAVQRPLRS